jgi:dihydroneopterin aldolase
MEFWNSQDYIRVLIKDLKVETQVGLHKWEQHPERPTRLILNVEMFARLDKKPNHERANIVDYDYVRNAVKKWPNRPHTPLLETLAEEVIGLCFENPRVEACRVSLVKPDIFNEADAVGVEIYRTRNEDAS